MKETGNTLDGIKRPIEQFRDEITRRAHPREQETKDGLIRLGKKWKDPFPMITLVPSHAGDIAV